MGRFEPILRQNGRFANALDVAGDFNETYQLGGDMRRALTLLVVTLFCVIGFASSAPAAEDKPSTTPNVVKVGSAAPKGAAVKEIDISAKKYQFTPASIVVPANTLLKIHLKAVDHEHGFEIKGFKKSCVKFKPTNPVTVEFYADKPGELGFRCCKFCGFGHPNMKGKLVVK